MKKIKFQVKSYQHKLILFGYNLTDSFSWESLLKYLRFKTFDDAAVPGFVALDCIYRVCRATKKFCLKSSNNSVSLKLKLIIFFIETFQFCRSFKPFIWCWSCKFGVSLLLIFRVNQDPAQTLQLYVVTPTKG